ncbi:hypothetical protein Dimus_020459, partial [Dionaea muscipula]
GDVTRTRGSWPPLLEVELAARGAAARAGVRTSTARPRSSAGRKEPLHARACRLPSSLSEEGDRRSPIS